MALSDDTIDKLIKTLVDREESVHYDVLKVIANRINQIGTLKQTDLIKLRTLIDRGGDTKKINKLLSDLTNKQVKDIEKLIRDVARNSYVDVKKYYDSSETPFLRYDQNKQLQRVVNTIARNTANTYKNLANTRAFMVYDSRLKRYRPTKMSSAYNKLIDKSIQASQSGLTNWEYEKRKIVKQMLDKNIRFVSYQKDTGKKYTQRVDTAVDRTIRDGIREIMQGVQDFTGKEFGADGKEISVHAFPAPDHEPIQGHRFTNEEYDKLQNNKPFKDVDGNRFKAIERSIGIWNCRHFTFSVILADSTPNYTQKELDEIIKRNHKGYTTDKGKKLTMYECTQLQRQYELDIRKAKEDANIAKLSGNSALFKEYSLEASKLIKKYNSFSKACGLKVKPNKYHVEKIGS